MTESEWLSCRDPQKMLDFLRDDVKTSERKLRMFAVACCRRVGRHLVDRRSRNAVEVAERVADGRASESERQEAYTAAWAAVGADAVTLASEVDAARAAGRTVQPEAFQAALFTAREAGYVPTDLLEEELADVEATTVPEAVPDDVEYGEDSCQCHLLRDLFGNPFRAAPAVASSWLSWNERTIVRLAQSVYEDRILPEGTLDKARLAILADALEEAGCADEEILGHCRSPNDHVRGCWLIDLLLGRR